MDSATTSHARKDQYRRVHGSQSQPDRMHSGRAPRADKRVRSVRLVPVPSHDQAAHGLRDGGGGLPRGSGTNAADRPASRLEVDQIGDEPAPVRS